MRENNIPIHSPLYTSNMEYYAKDVRSITAICEAEEDAIKNLLLDTPFNYYTNKIIIEGGIFHKCTLGDFNNSGIIIPVEFEGKYGGYYAYCYVTTDASLALGREPYGYPKKIADISYQDNKHEIISTTSRNGKEIIKMNSHFIDKKAEKPIIEWMPHFLLNIIPELDGKSLLVNRVIKRDTSKPPTKVIERKMLNTSISFGDSSDDPISKLGVKRVLQSFYTETDFHWAPGELLKDLNKKE